MKTIPFRRPALNLAAFGCLALLVAAAPAGAGLYGAVAFCVAGTAGTFTMQTDMWNLAAFWSSTPVRTGDVAGGCLFMCSSGNCFVGSDGGT